MKDGFEYFLGTHDYEIFRLGYQHHAWASQTFKLWEIANFGLDQTLMDLGSGPGFATTELAHLVGPRGQVLALDASTRYLSLVEEKAKVLNLSQIKGFNVDITKPMPEMPLADGAFTRWVFCFLKNPEVAIANVRKQLKPGGRFVIMDYYNYLGVILCPRSQAFDRVKEAVFASWRKEGGDLDIGCRLPTLLGQGGFRVSHLEAYHRVAKPRDSVWNWPRLFFWDYVPKLVERGFLKPEDRVAFEKEWLKRESEPGSYFVTPPMVGIVAEAI